MEYLVVLLVIALIAVVYFKQPNKVYEAVTSSLIETLAKKEGEIVQGLYNKLPQNIKDKIDSQTIAEIVGILIGVVTDILGFKGKEKM